MKEMQGRCASVIGVGRVTRLVLLLLTIASTASILASPAWGSLGYELDASNPSFEIDGVPRGLAVDQANRDLYVAIMTKDLNALTPGEIQRFNSDLSADGIFAAGAGYYTGVGVNPLTHGFYGAQAELRFPSGNYGTPRLDRFSSTGASAGSSVLGYSNALPVIATDAEGNVFYPNRAAHSVQVFDSAGVLQEEITCGGCSGGSFGAPVSVALNSKDDLYVVDIAPDRVVKLTSTAGGAYSFASLLQSGRGAGAVGIDIGTDDVLVGDLPKGKNFHIVAYHSSGVQFDDFGAGLFLNPGPEFNVVAASQMAVDATTHKIYVSEFEKIYIFDKVTINPPTATIGTGTNIGQQVATPTAMVNANGHAVLECEFEYTDDADFQVNGFANAAGAPCTELPTGSTKTTVHADVSGLQPATTYHFRVTATNNAGSVTSTGQTFETLPVTPATVTTESPIEVTEMEATLKGRVNPRGGSVSSCYFELGPTVSYGTSFPCTSLPAPVSVEVAESRDIAELAPSTTYHYRLVVTTNAGMSNGNDVEFTTATPPPPPGPVPEPASTPPATTEPPSSTGTVTTPPPLRCKKGFRKRRVRGKVRCVKRKRANRHVRRHRAHQ